MKYDNTLSSVAFDCSVRPYITVRSLEVEAAYYGDGLLLLCDATDRDDDARLFLAARDLTLPPHLQITAGPNANPQMGTGMGGGGGYGGMMGGGMGGGRAAHTRLFSSLKHHQHNA